MQEVLDQGCAGFREQRVSEKNSSRKLADQARLPTPRYQVGMRVYASEFPRMDLLTGTLLRRDMRANKGRNTLSITINTLKLSCKVGSFAAGRGPLSYFNKVLITGHPRGSG